MGTVPEVKRASRSANRHTVRQRIPLLATLLLFTALLWHVFGQVLPAWQTSQAHFGGGRDFASYYYAALAASEGEDPYEVRRLTALAREQGERRSVHPFLYPPPFLLMVAWAPQLDLRTAHAVWFWLDAAWAVLTGLALWRWWRPLGNAVPVLVAGLVAANTAVASNHLMGQANFPALALAVAAMFALERRRVGWAGALLGTACMLKMSPALLVLWWLWRGEWRAVSWACATAVALSVAALPLVPADVQLGFYMRVLPTFASGDYNGLRVPIDLFGNHSIPNLWATLWPVDGMQTLSPHARAASVASSLALLLGLGWAFRRPAADRVQLAAQFAAVCVVMLLLPVYTWEHHVVWALPAAVLALLALLRGWLPGPWAVLVLPCIVLWCLELSLLRAQWSALGQTTPAALAIRELKFVALLGLLAVSLTLGAGPGRVEAGGPFEARSLRSRYEGRDRPR